VTIVLNGDERDDLDAPLTVRELLDVLELVGDARGVAVAVDASVVPRGEWPTFVVADGARVEILVAVQGG